MIGIPNSRSISSPVDTKVFCFFCNAIVKCDRIALYRELDAHSNKLIPIVMVRTSSLLSWIIWFVSKILSIDNIGASYPYTVHAQRKYLHAVHGFQHQVLCLVHFELRDRCKVFLILDFCFTCIIILIETPSRMVWLIDILFTPWSASTALLTPAMIPTRLTPTTVNN